MLSAFEDDEEVFKVGDLIKAKDIKKIQYAHENGIQENEYYMVYRVDAIGTVIEIEKDDFYFISNNELILFEKDCDNKTEAIELKKEFKIGDIVYITDIGKIYDPNLAKNNGFSSREPYEIIRKNTVTNGFTIKRDRNINLYLSENDMAFVNHYNNKNALPIYDNTQDVSFENEREAKILIEQLEEENKKRYYELAIDISLEKGDYKEASRLHQEKNKS